MIRRLAVILASTAIALVASAGIASAGEITGNGELIEVNGHSACAFSGQEDLQFYEDDHQGTLKPEPTKGDPSHAQSWGQIPKSVRDFLTTVGAHPGDACNPTKGFEE